MKKFVILTLLGFILVCCTATRPVATGTSQQQLVDTPTVWKQSFLRMIKPNDSIVFYNSSEIIIESPFINQSVSIKEGKLIVSDSIVNVKRVVPILTPGVILELKKNSFGDITDMMVSFSKIDKTYQFIFIRTNKPKSFVWRKETKWTSECFVLNNKAELIFDGHRYPITATSIGDCILLFYFQKQKSEIDDVKQAEGLSVKIE